MEAIEVNQISERELDEINEQCVKLGARYEELFSFIYDLRQADFKVGTPQIIAIHRLLIALARNGEDPFDFRRLKTYIAPLVCSSPEEQSDFYNHFDRWLETHQPPAPHTGFAPPVPAQWNPEINSSTFEQSKPRNRRRSPALTAITFLATILFLGSFVSYYVIQNSQNSLLPIQSQAFEGTVIDDKTNQPLADAKVVLGEQTYQTNAQGVFNFEYQPSSDSQPLTISRDGYETINAFIEPKETSGEYSMTQITTSPPSSTPAVLPATNPTTAPIQSEPPPLPPLTFYQQYYFYLLTAAALLPFVIYGLWLVWRWRRRRQLERWRERNAPDFKNLTLRKEENYLYRSAAFRRSAQELRRHRRVSTSTLDVYHTVEATVREGGLFKPVLGSQQVSPEYLVLIDRLGFRDQKAHLEDKILDRFKKEGVFFECFYFNGDPRLCRQKNPNRADENPKYFKLQDLSATYAHHRLLIFSDGAGMVDEFFNRPHRWVNLLAQWEVRALLTPNSAINYHEWILEQEADLPVLPAHEADLKSLEEIIRTGASPKTKAYAADRDYPPTLLEDSEHWWLRRVRPSQKDSDGPDKVEMLNLELRYYLGQDGYFLLCACAVYPELTGDLTFYLAYRFIAPANREATLEALVCLPWFRQAMMPDWLREELLADLTFEQETEVREAIEQLLINYLEHPHEGFNLEIATQKPTVNESFWKHWRRRKFFHDVVKTEPENSPLRDYVFLKFISGSKLAVSLPRKLSRFLQSKSDTRRAFLRRFYVVCANVVKSIGNLWQKIYRRNLPISGVSKRKGVLVPIFASVIIAGTLSLMPPTFRTVDSNDLRVIGSNTDDSPLPPIQSDEPFQNSNTNSTANAAANSSVNAIATSSAKNSPTTPPKPKCEVGKCCTNLTAADGYVITSIWAQSTDFPEAEGYELTNDYPIGPKYIGTKTIYSAKAASDIGRDALQILPWSGADTLRGFCPVILPPSSYCPAGKCVRLNVYVQTSGMAPSTTPKNIEQARNLPQSVFITLRDQDTKERIDNGKAIITYNAPNAPPGDSYTFYSDTSYISLLPGSYTVKSSADNYIPKTQTFEVPAWKTNLLIELKKDGTPTPTPTPTRKLD